MKTLLNEWVGEGMIYETPILRHTTDSNRPVTNFLLILDQPYKSKKGQTNDFVIKHRIEKIPITAWANVAEQIHESGFVQNDFVRIKGAIRTRLVEDRKGAKHCAFEIICSEIKRAETTKESVPNNESRADQ